MVIVVITFQHTIYLFISYSTECTQSIIGSEKTLKEEDGERLNSFYFAFCKSNDFTSTSSIRFVSNVASSNRFSFSSRIFNHTEDIHQNYQELLYYRDQTRMELDVYIPPLRLAFEYQVNIYRSLRVNSFVLSCYVFLLLLSLFMYIGDSSLPISLYVWGSFQT